MTKPIRQRPLHDHEIEMIRLVATGYTNAQLATEFDISVETIRSRMHVVHRLIGSASGGDDSMARVRMVIWAYDHDLVQPIGVKPATAKDAPPQNRIPADLAAPMIRLSLDLLRDQPRGDCKRWARRVVDAAGLPLPPEVRRERPSVGLLMTDDATAAS